MIGKTLNKAMGLVDKFVLDKDAAIQLKAGLADTMIGAASKSDQNQTEINKIEADPGSAWYQKLWRPSLAGVCILYLLALLVVLLIVIFGSGWGYDMSGYINGIRELESVIEIIIYPLIIVLVGGAGYRTIEKSVAMIVNGRGK